MAISPTFEELLRRLPSAERVVLLEEAGVARDIDRGLQFDPEEIRSLLPFVLRRLTVDDATFAQLTAEAKLSLSYQGTADTIQISVPYVSRSHSERMPITELAAASMIVWEVSYRAKWTLEAIGVREEFNPPEVSVEAGSTSFTLGGGSTLAAGVGMIIAAHAVVPLGMAADLAFFGGALVGTMGFLDLVFGWRKTFAETRGFDAQTQLHLASERLALANEKLVQLHAQSEAARLSPAPASALVPMEHIVAEARRYGLETSTATHLINQVLPALHDANSYYPKQITASKSTSRRSSASSS